MSTTAIISRAAETALAREVADMATALAFRAKDVCWSTGLFRYLDARKYLRPSPMQKVPLVGQT